jgi:hypothetical protein
VFQLKSINVSQVILVVVLAILSANISKDKYHATKALEEVDAGIVTLDGMLFTMKASLASFNHSMGVISARGESNISKMNDSIGNFIDEMSAIKQMMVETEIVANVTMDAGIKVNHILDLSIMSAKSAQLELNNTMSQVKDLISGISMETLSLSNIEYTASGKISSFYKSGGSTDHMSSNVYGVLCDPGLYFIRAFGQVPLQTSPVNVYLGSENHSNSGDISTLTHFSLFFYVKIKKITRVGIMINQGTIGTNSITLEVNKLWSYSPV